MIRSSPAKILALAAWLAAVALSVPAAAAAPGAPWRSPDLRDHPLAGRIWQPAAGRFVEPGAVVEALAAAPFVLLGEKHDNADHHRIQAWLLAELARRGRRPAVAWEMFTLEQAGAIAGFLARHPHDADGLGPAAGWAKSGWPDWAIYRPIAAAALEAGLPLLAAGLPRGEIRAVAREGLSAFDAAELRSLALDRAVPEAQRAAIREEVIEVHCRQLPESMIDPMVQVTAAKDAFMARRLRDGAGLSGADGAVLIAGNGHVRADRGVPWHLARQAPDRVALAVGIQEVFEGETDPAAYAASYNAEALPFDFVWFTPRVDSEDPCAVYADQLKKAREKHQQQQGD